MSNGNVLPPIVGAMHKNCIQDFVTNLQLEMTAEVFGMERVMLSDLPEREVTRKLIANAFARMKQEGYKPILTGDMVIFYDTGDEVPLYQRPEVPEGVFMTQGEVDKATPVPLEGDETPTLGSA